MGERDDVKSDGDGTPNFPQSALLQGIAAAFHEGACGSPTELPEYFVLDGYVVEVEACPPPKNGKEKCYNLFYDECFTTWVSFTGDDVLCFEDLNTKHNCCGHDHAAHEKPCLPRTRVWLKVNNGKLSGKRMLVVHRAVKVYPTCGPGQEPRGRRAAGGYIGGPAGWGSVLGPIGGAVPGRSTSEPDFSTAGRPVKQGEVRGDRPLTRVEPLGGWGTVFGVADPSGRAGGDTGRVANAMGGGALLPIDDRSIAGGRGSDLMGVERGKLNGGPLYDQPGVAGNIRLPTDYFPSTLPMLGLGALGGPFSLGGIAGNLLRGGSR